MKTTYTAINRHNANQVFPSVTAEEKVRLEKASPNQYNFVPNEVVVVPDEIKIKDVTEAEDKKPSRSKKSG